MDTITEQVFGVWDYTIFGVMLAVSTGIGVYFGFFAHAANTTDEYLLGGKRMKTIPIAISLVASQMSGVSILTMPAEIYTYGVNFVFHPLSVFLAIPLLSLLILPVFYNNNISNCYEYLARRFDPKIKKIITIIFLIKVFLILPLYIFVPSLAFAQVSGLNIHVINTVVCSICVFYTMLGGIKAVVWTDVFQGFIMLASMFVVLLLGIQKVGGIGEVISKSAEGGRFNLDTTFDLTTRVTVWNTLISGILGYVSHNGFNQSCVQRLVALPSLRQGQIALLIFGFGLLTFIGCINIMGFVMFSSFSDCDPLKAGIVEKADKLVPYFVQNIAGHIPGMSGFFVSCVFSAALSTISANLNSLSGIIYFDYIQPRIKHTEAKANSIMKGIVVLTGIYCILAGVIVEQSESILQFSLTISGVAYGSLFGVFMLGILAPKAHTKPTYVALIISLIVSIIIAVNGKIQTLMGTLRYDTLPTSIEGCSIHNITVHESSGLKFSGLPVAPEVHPFDISKMSFQWYVTAGSLLVWIIGIPLSYIMHPGKTEKVDSKLFASIVQKFMTKEMDMEYSEVPIKEKVDHHMESKA